MGGAKFPCIEGELREFMTLSFVHKLPVTQQNLRVWALQLNTQLADRSKLRAMDRSPEDLTTSRGWKRFLLLTACGLYRYIVRVAISTQ